MAPPVVPHLWIVRLLLIYLFLPRVVGWYRAGDNRQYQFHYQY
jgi:hypothetical protein